MTEFKYTEARLHLLKLMKYNNLYLKRGGRFHYYAIPNQKHFKISALNFSKIISENLIKCIKCSPELEVYTLTLKGLGAVCE